MLQLHSLYQRTCDSNILTMIKVDSELPLAFGGENICKLGESVFAILHLLGILVLIMSIHSGIFGSYESLGDFLWT